MSKSVRVARNIATTFISQVVSWALTFAVILVLPHYAGVAGYGKLALAASYAGIFGLISAVGTSTVMIRDIPREPESAGRLVIGSLLVRIPLALVAIVIAEIIGRWAGYDHDTLLFIAINLGIGMIGIVTDTLGSAFRGLESFAAVNIGTVIDKAVGSAMTILVCLLKWPLWVIVATPLLSACFSTVYLIKRVSSLKLDWKIPDLAFIKSLALAGLPFLSAGIFVTIYGRTDALFLAKLSTISSIGWYALGNRLAGTAMSLPAVVCAAMLPTLSALFRENKTAFADATSRLTNLMVISCIPISAVMICSPHPLVVLLSHGTPSFYPADNVVRINGFNILFWYVSQAVFTGIIACDQQKVIASSMGIAALVGVPITGGCIYFTQHFYHNGATGAAFSDLVTEVYLVICYCKALPAGSVSLSILTAGLRAFVAAIPIVALLLLVPPKYALYAAVPGVLIYGLICLRLKCLHSDDMLLFSRLIGGKFGLSKA